MHEILKWQLELGWLYDWEPRRMSSKLLFKAHMCPCTYFHQLKWKTVFKMTLLTYWWQYLMNSQSTAQFRSREEVSFGTHYVRSLCRSNSHCFDSGLSTFWQISVLRSSYNSFLSLCLLLTPVCSLRHWIFSSQCKDGGAVSHLEPPVPISLLPARQRRMWPVPSSLLLPGCLLSVSLGNFCSLLESPSSRSQCCSFPLFFYLAHALVL